MLGKEIATALRGRNLVYTLLPLSFDEYCGFKSVSLTDQHSTRAKALLLATFEQYLLFGGYPETALQKDELIQKTLQSYFDVMVFRDIVERHGISNVAALKNFLKRLLNNISNKASVHKIYNEMKSQGLSVSKDITYQYLEHAIDCFLLFALSPHEPSHVKQQARARKIYAVDTGLINAVTFRYLEDKGRLMENVVFLQLIRKEHDVTYLNDKAECDFIIHQRESVIAAMQVCLSLKDEVTRNREINGLLNAISQFDLSEGYIITLDEQDEIEMEGKRIIVYPCWKWLLS